MSNRRDFVTKTIPGLVLGAAALSAPAIVRANKRPVIRVGLGPQQPTQADTKRVWEPVYKMICDQIGADLELRVANDWAGISVALATQQIDVAQMGPWGYVLAKKKGEAQAIGMLTIQGRDYYKAIVVARPDLKITRFPEDAKGLSMQMLDVGSTSGWLVPTHFLKSKGIDPKNYFGKYAEGASAAAAQMATVNGQVDLATGWDTHRNTMIRNGQITETSNRVVWESQPLPNEPVVIRSGFDPEMAKRLQAALAGLPADVAQKMLPWPYSGFISTDHAPYAKLETMGTDLGVLKA
ncbi:MULTISPECIES: phosphate/phosphite/phosphonate ABC transporter substrate-binding protein [Limnobacter]|uniref:Phosphate/phosphite/phosphonate ABC transporter substrate-binding protein n=1 Tax=Limnobacter profundi TaxID=2732163 RepID=A0ABX6N849_9BURK|nr:MULTISPECIES: phosphate/phosphite/phosphonate ABC transporter substrate-binding protein [unclassified Limnobacter]MDZ4051028.1 phosphate/phosphite/phosphonate ABC transporter substrate-binding protein [Limnobacter sp.]QJR30080.1 phosphate/phosphite/phosphonate ABC transporter substrate-binding protein [Limnobacter sp. SAORIC-580]